MGKRLFLFCLLTVCLIFSACRMDSGKSDFSDVDMNTADISVAELAETLCSSIVFDDALVPLDAEIAGRLYGVVGLYESIAAYGSTGATAEAVVVLRCTDAENAVAASSFVDEYRKEMADVYAAYNAKESEKLQNAFLTVSGKYVVFCVSPDAKAAAAAYHSAVAACAGQK